MLGWLEREGFEHDLYSDHQLHDGTLDLDAYRALTEQVYGQQLDATTTVAEMMITSDTFRTRVQGAQPAGFVPVPPTLEDVYFGVMDESRANDAARAGTAA